ncbi:hypothetical protein 043JT007_216 [Bacillus phage 043JT007]|nr:hypothetical protein 043JT007_216 [Bacillus phage 043JT007]
MSYFILRGSVFIYLYILYSISVIFNIKYYKDIGCKKMEIENRGNGGKKKNEKVAPNTCQKLQSML